nr:immunoglobulin heavy chain junction region [Mus musculus]
CASPSYYSNSWFAYW